MANEIHDDPNDRFPKPPRRVARVTGAAAKQHYGNLADVPAPCGATVGSFTLTAPMVTCRECQRALRAAAKG
jgi:hypothetical protein